MRIKKLRMENWRQYESASVQFVGHAIGIVGPNGCGKSSILDAIKFGIFGSSDRVKAENVRFGAESGFIEVEFEHHVHTYRVRRSIEGSTCKLSGPDLQLSKARDVDSFLADLFEVPTSIFDQHVFVGQGDLDTLPRQSESELLSYFQPLFGVDRCEKIRLLLQKYIAELPSDAPSSDIEAMDRMLIDHRSRAQQAADQLKLVTTDLAPLNHESDKAAMQAYEARQRLAQQESDINRSIELAQANIASTEQLIDQHQSKCDELRGILEDPNVLKAFKEATDNLENLKQLRDKQAVKQRTVSDLNAARQERQSLGSPPAEPSGLANASNLQEQLTTIAERIKTRQHFCDTFSTGTPVCPTCGTDVAERAPKLVSEYQTELKDLHRQHWELSETLQKLRTAASEYQRALSLYQHKMSGLDGRIVQLERNLSDIGDVPDLVPSDHDIHTWKTLISDFEASRVSLNAHTSSLSDARLRLSNYRNMLDQAVRTKESLGTSVAGHVVSQGEYDAARENLDRHARLMNLKQQAEITIQNVDLAIEKLTSELSQAKARYDERLRRVQARKFLEEVRSLFHKEALPLRLSQHHLEGLNRTLAEVLIDQQFPFSCRIDNDFRLVCTDRSGHTMSAKRLSGGLRVMFSVALRMAINARFAPSIGLLTMDEPTYFVDEQNVDTLRESMIKSGEYLRGSGVQLIIVTHEPRLRPVFDQIVDVADLRQI